MMKNRIGLASQRAQRAGAALMAAALLAATTLPSGAAEPRNGVDARADEILKRMSDCLSKAGFFSVKAEIWQDIRFSNGQHVQAGRTLQLRLRRPNRLRAEVHSTRRDRQMIYDGRTITLFNKAENFYG
ncbi:MAG TPA: DUF2092 domain-containing protein, partial [Verrucomicrobiae bacterium]|nr:DUF2092 domain-containing protein [Verrucomicrobiae bacterium]